MSDEGKRDLGSFKNPEDAGYQSPGKVPGSLFTSGDTMRDVFYGLRQWYVENDKEDEYKQAKDWAIKQQMLMPIIQQVFNTHDTNQNLVIDESEWVAFAFDVASRASQQGITVPPMDEDIVRRYYYAFNHTSNKHKGVSLDKLAVAIRAYGDFDKKNKKLAQERQAFIQGRGRMMLCFSIMWVVFIVVAILTACDPYAIRGKFDQQQGYVSSDFQRQAVSATIDRDYNCRKNNVSYCDDNALQWSRCEADAYWNEEGMVTISQSAETKLLEAGYEIHNMALEAVDLIVNNDTLLDLFYINRDLWPAIKASWNSSQTDFQGRFDFAWTGNGEPKLLEYNADTPSLQIESSRLHHDWFTSYIRQNNIQPGTHQSNYFEGKVRDFASKINDYCGFRDAQSSDQNSFGFMVNTLDEENMAVMLMFRDIFKSYHYSLDLVDVSDLDFKYFMSYDYNKRLVNNTWQDTKTRKQYNCLLGMYPKEWLISEQPNYPMKKYDWKNLKSFEPFWKLLLGNKALLPLLWSMYPNHPNLLPAYYDDPKQQLGASYFNSHFGSDTKWVSKPIFGREGMGVFFSSNFSSYDDFVQRTESNYGYDKEGSKLGKSIYQQESDLAQSMGRIIQTSVWMIGGAPAGLAFREGKQGHHFEDTNPFIQHMVKNSHSTSYFDYRTNKNQRNLRQKLYRTVTPGSSYWNNGFRDYDVQRTANNYSWMLWKSVPAAHSRVQQYHQQDQQTYLDDIDASYIRWLSLPSYNQISGLYPPNMSRVDRFLGYNGYSRTQHQNLYSVPQKQFGSISGYDMRYQGYWFSVDRHGVIRRHTYSSAGFGRS